MCSGSFSRTCARASQAEQFESAGIRCPAASSTFRRQLRSQFRTISSFRHVRIRSRSTRRRPWRPRTAPTEVDTWRGRLPLRRSARRERVGARRRGRPRGPVRDRPGGRRVRTRRVENARRRAPARQPCHVSCVHPPQRCSRQLARARLGHDAPDVVLRHAAVAERDRPVRDSPAPRSWIDWERDLYIVLLANRVHPTRQNEQLRALRPRISTTRSLRV